MDANFDAHFVELLKDEGGLVEHKLDPGGITKYGVSIRFLKDIGLDINKDNIINAKDIRDLTVDQAKSIYKIYFWDKLHIQSIENPDIQEKVFNLAVNMGGKTAIGLLQEAINFHASPHIVADGIIGKKTIKALNSINPDVLLTDYRLVAKLYYTRLVQRNPNLRVFLDGWLKRASE